jgi:signal transduction histidine kinase
VACLIGIVAFTAFALVDPFLVADPRWLYVARAIIVGAIAVPLGLSYTRAGLRWIEALVALACFTMGAGIVALAKMSGGVESAYHGELFLVFLGFTLLTPWRAPVAGAVFAAILACYDVVLLAPASWRITKEIVERTFLLFTGAAIATTGLALANRLRRMEFDGRRRLREMGARLAVTNRKLKELDRRKSDFFANVSHELRTPLTLILGPLEALHEDPRSELPERLREVCDSMRRNGARLLKLINELLELSKLEAGKVRLRYAPLELHGFLRAALPPFGALAQRRRVLLTLEGAPADPVHVDAEKMEIVFQNLVANALKFTPEGGAVTVRVLERADRVTVEVEDTGIGIAPQDLPIVFDRFAQADSSATRRFGGTGIGLSLVKELVELHGGAAEVRSEVGRGSTFSVNLPRGTAHVREELRERRRVDLPVALDRRESGRDPMAALVPKVRTEDLLEQAHPGPPAPEAPPGSERVLVVEDNADLRSFLGFVLGRHYRVAFAADGEEGFAEAVRGRPDLVLSDVMMPRRSGHELCRALREDQRTAGIPVILLSARTGAEPAVEGLAQGADDYVGKPFSPRELLARVRAQLRIRELSRQLAQSEKMAMVGTLTAGLAHEVLNPVNAILNCVPFLLKRLPRDEVASGGVTSAELVDAVDEAARRIHRIVRDLLDFAHADRAEVAEWRPSEGIASTLRLLRARTSGLTVTCDLQFDGSLQARAGSLNQVLMNLLDNALRAVGDRGSITVRTRAEAGGVSITVQDSGPGIDPDVLPRVFDPFFTTREVGEGSGLGLHLARRIVESHGGEISAASTPGEGATFTVWLPPARPLDPARPRDLASPQEDRAALERRAEVS